MAAAAQTCIAAGVIIIEDTSSEDILADIYDHLMAYLDTVYRAT